MLAPDFWEEVRFAFGDFVSGSGTGREDEDASRPRLGDFSVFPDDRCEVFIVEDDDFFFGEAELLVEPFLPIE